MIIVSENMVLLNTCIGQSSEHLSMEGSLHVNDGFGARNIVLTFGFQSKSPTLYEIVEIYRAATIY